MVSDNLLRIRVSLRTEGRENQRSLAYKFTHNEPLILLTGVTLILADQRGPTTPAASVRTRDEENTPILQKNIFRPGP